MGTPVQRSIRLTPNNAITLDRSSGEAGGIVYDITNQTLRLNNGQLNGGHLLATRTWTESQITASAFSGSYNDLTDKPTLFDGDYASLTNKPTLFDGNYNSLTNKPTLFDGNYDNLTNKPSIPSMPSLATVATTGSYTDLANKPSIPTLPTLATVATTGAYSDLTGKPTSFANLTSLSMSTGGTITRFSTDGTLAGNSNSNVATERAVKTYVDTAVAGVGGGGGGTSVPQFSALLSKSVTAPSGFVETFSTVYDGTLGGYYYTVGGQKFPNERKCVGAVDTFIDVSAINVTDPYMYSAHSLGNQTNGNTYLCINDQKYWTITAPAQQPGGGIFAKLDKSAVTGSAMNADNAYANCTLIQINSDVFWLFGLSASKVWQYKYSTNTFTQLTLTGSNLPSSFCTAVWINDANTNVYMFNANDYYMYNFTVTTGTTVSVTREGQLPVGLRGDAPGIAHWYKTGYEILIFGLGPNNDKVAAYDRTSQQFITSLPNGGSAFQDAPQSLRWAMTTETYDNNTKYYGSMTLADLSWCNKTYNFEPYTGVWTETLYSPPNASVWCIGATQIGWMGCRTVPIAGLASYRIYSWLDYRNPNIYARYIKS